MLVLSLLFLGVVARYTLFFDSADYVQELFGGVRGMEIVEGKVERDVVRSAIMRGHHGDGPCLRDAAEVEQSQLDEFEEEVAAAGLTERFVENVFLVYLFSRWTSDWEAEFHELEHGEELIAVATQEVGAWDRLLIWLNHDKLVDTLRDDDAWVAERLEAQTAALDPQELEVLRSIWTGCRACTTPLAMLRLIDPMKHRLSLAKMDRIEACLQARPILPLSLRGISCIEDDDLLDGWGGYIEYEAATSELVSLGADGTEGGSGWDADIRERVVHQ